MKLLARTIAFLLAILLLLGVLAGCAGALDPLGYLKDSMERALRESLAGQILGVFFDAVQGGSLALDFGGTDLVGGLPDEAKLKLWLDADDERAALDASLVLAGERFEAQAFLDEYEIAAISPTFLGSNTLGFDFNALEADLRNSIFSNNSGTVFAHPDISAASASRVNAIKNGAFSLLDTTEDGLESVEEGVEYFLEALSTYASHTRHKENGCVYISLDINNDSLSRALRATHEMVADDRSLVKFVQQIAKTVDSICSAATGVNDTSLTDRVKYFLNSEADIDALCVEIDRLPAFTLAVQARVRSFGMDLETFRATLTQEGAVRADLSLELAEEGEQSKLSLLLDGVLREVTVRVVKDSYRNYAAELGYRKITDEGIVLSVTGDLQANKRDKTYTLSLAEGEQLRVLKGKYVFSDEEILLAVDGVTLGGENRKLSFSLSIKAEDRVPQMPQYQNVVKMDVTRFTPIYERAVQALDKFKGLWQSASFTPHGVLGSVLGTLGLERELAQ